MKLWLKFLFEQRHVLVLVVVVVIVGFWFLSFDNF